MSLECVIDRNLYFSMKSILRVTRSSVILRFLRKNKFSTTLILSDCSFDYQVAIISLVTESIENRDSGDLITDEIGYYNIYVFMRY